MAAAHIGIQLDIEHAETIGVGDCCWHIDDIYKVYDVAPDARGGRVRIYLESCRWGPIDLPLIGLVPVERSPS